MSVKISDHDQWTMMAIPRTVATLNPPVRSMRSGYGGRTMRGARMREQTVKRRVLAVVPTEVVDRESLRAEL
jgi:hypothetical protein